jgi:hypothetical protein
MSFTQVILDLSRPIVEISNRYNKSDIELYVESKRPLNVAEAEYWMREYHYKNGDVFSTPAKTSTAKKDYGIVKFFKSILKGIVKFLKGILEGIVDARMAKAHMIVTGTRGS